MTTPIKVTYQGEMRRFALSGTQPTIGDLDLTLRRVYGSLGNQPIRIAYADDDGDSVTVRSDDELQYAISALTNLHIIITTEASSHTDTSMDVEPPAPQQQPPQHPPQQPSQQPSAAPEPEPEPKVHVGVTCDFCGVSPIVGIRYKCAIREDFDMCEACEAAAEPTHPLIKIPTRALAPVAILCVLREDGQPNSPEAAAAAATADFARAAEFARRYLASRGPGALGGLGCLGGFGFRGPLAGLFGAGGQGPYRGGRGGTCGRPSGSAGGSGCGSRAGGAHEAEQAAAPAAAAAVAPAAPADPAAAFQSRMEAWQAELQALEQMGFIDVARNVELLERYSRVFGPSSNGGGSSGGSDGSVDSRARGMALVLQDLMAGAAAPLPSTA